MFSSDQMRASWRYALDHDFVPSNYDGQPLVTSTQFEYTADHLHMPLKRRLTGWSLSLSVNADETLLATAVDSEIDVYILSKGRFWGTLRGHTGGIDSVQISPVGPFELVSAASHETL